MTEDQDGLPEASLERSAYHEAGHAVLAYQFRCRRLKCIAVLLIGKCASCRFENVKKEPETIDELEREIMVLMAGKIEVKNIKEFTRERNSPSLSDDRNIKLLLQKLCKIKSDAKTVGDLKNDLEQRTTKFLQDENIRNAVDEVAVRVMNRVYEHDDTFVKNYEIFTKGVIEVVVPGAEIEQLIHDQLKEFHPE